MMREGVQVIVKCLALTKELRTEKQVELLFALSGIMHVEVAGIANGNGGFDHHSRIWINLKHKVNHLFYVTGVKEVLQRVLVGMCRNDNKVCIFVGGFAIESGCEAQILLCQIFLNVVVLNG